MSDSKIEKRPSRGNLRLTRESPDYSQWLDTMEAELGGRFFKLFRGPMWSGPALENHKNPKWSRKQKTERVRRERINSSLDELKSLVCKGDEKHEKLDKADILEATVNYVRNARVAEYQQNPKFRAGYNQCVSEFVQFLVSLDNVKADDKAKLLAGMSNVLCGVKEQDENTVNPSSSPISPTPLPSNRPYSFENGKIPISRLQRQPLQTITNVVTTCEMQTTISYSSQSESSSSISNRGSVSSPVSDSSTSSLSAVSWFNDEITPTQTEDVEPSFGNIYDVFCDGNLGTSLGEAVGAGIKLELADLPSLKSDEDGLEEIVGLPPMCTFLE